MGRGLGDRQRRLLDWMQEQIKALAAGAVYENDWYLYVAPEGAQVQDLGVPFHRMADTYVGETATAAELEATRRAIRTLQDRGRIAETKVQLGEVWLRSSKSKDLQVEAEQARRSPKPVAAFVLQPEGAEPVERWRRPKISINGVYRDAILAHVTGQPQDWLMLEPAMLQTVEALAVERFGEQARWMGRDRHRLVTARQRMEARRRLVVDRAERWEGARRDGFTVCRVYLPGA